MDFLGHALGISTYFTTLNWLKSYRKYRPESVGKAYSMAKEKQLPVKRAAKFFSGSRPNTTGQGEMQGWPF